jgi:hypothetical protein
MVNMTPFILTLPWLRFFSLLCLPELVPRKKHGIWVGPIYALIMIHSTSTRI